MLLFIVIKKKRTLKYFLYYFLIGNNHGCKELKIIAQGIGFFFGMIFGGISLSNIKENPEKFKGKGMAKFSFILSTIVVGVSLLLILLIIGILLI